MVRVQRRHRCVAELAYLALAQSLDAMLPSVLLMLVQRFQLQLQVGAGRGPTFGHWTTLRDAIRAATRRPRRVGCEVD